MIVCVPSTSLADDEKVIVETFSERIDVKKGQVGEQSFPSTYIVPRLRTSERRRNILYSICARSSQLEVHKKDKFWKNAVKFSSETAQ